MSTTPAAAAATAATPAAAAAPAPAAAAPTAAAAPPAAPTPAETPAWQRAARVGTRLNEWDEAAWKRMVRAAQARTLDEARPVYEEIVARFPTSSVAWTVYIEHAMKEAGTATAVASDSTDTTTVDALFTRCLAGGHELFAEPKLWIIYARYIRETRIDAVRRAGGESTALARAHAEMREAFGLATKAVGSAFGAGPLWSAFATYEVQRFELGGATNRSETRKVFQSALTLPHSATDAIWTQYEAWEKESKNAAMAETTLKEWKAKILPIRAAVTAQARLWAGVDTELFATPPSAAPREQAQQLGMWRAIAEHERRNPLKVGAEELETRVRLVFNRALCCVRFIPEMWFDAADWEQRAASFAAGHHVPPSDDALERAARVLERGCKALPQCLTLGFAAASVYEKLKDAARMRQCFEDLLAAVVPVASGKAAAGGADKAHASAASLIFIEFQRLVRRIETVGAARGIFKRARETPTSTWHIYAAAARLELKANKDATVARKIFDLGLKKYEAEPLYVEQYAIFLEEQNDDNALRVLFERTLAAIPNTPAGKLSARRICEWR